MKTIFLILIFLTVFKTENYSKSVEADFYIPIINRLPDSIINKIKVIDENKFINSEYNQKDLNSSFSSWGLCINTIDTFLVDKFYISDICFKYFDSCFCQFDIEPVIENLRRGFHRYINHKPFDIQLELSKKKSECLKRDSLFHYRIKADSLHGKYIPKNIDEALNQILKLLSKERLDEIKNYREDNVIDEEHLNLGVFMRNYWELSSSRLTQYFVDNYEISDPEDISSIMLLLLHKKLNNKDLDIDNTIKNQLIKHEMK